MKNKKTGRDKCFNKRKRWLRKLGFGTYEKYLSSEIWQKIKHEILKRRNHKCHFCSGIATQVHHLRYTKPVLLGEGDYYMSGLVATCRNCHRDISIFAKEKKIHEDYAYQLYNLTFRQGQHKYRVRR